MNQTLKTWLLWVLLIMMFLAIWQFLSPDRPAAPVVPFSEFVTLVNADRERALHVTNVTIKDREYAFWVKDPKSATVAKRLAIGPENPGEILKTLEEKKITVAFEKEAGAPLGAGTVVVLLPILVLLGMFYFVQRAHKARFETLAGEASALRADLERERRRADEEKERADRAEERLAGQGGGEREEA
jgi:cell division protease FtsH